MLLISIKLFSVLDNKGTQNEAEEDPAADNWDDGVDDEPEVEEQKEVESEDLTNHEEEKPGTTLTL